MRNGDEHDEASLEDALRAPGSAEELAQEERYVAMFRAARSAAPATAAGGAARTAMRRLGAGGTLAVVFAVASAGVAAAYSRSLPDPVQRAFHSVLAPIGVPAAEPRPQPGPPEARTSAEPTPAEPSPAPATSSAAPSGPAADPSVGPSRSAEPSAPSTPDATPTTEPSAGERPTDTATPTDPATTEVPVSPAPSASPSPTVTPSPTGSTAPGVAPTQPVPSTPTTTPAPVRTPASVRIVSAGADQRVAAGGTAVVAGEVRSVDDAPVADVAVALQARTDGAWHRVSTARSAEDGSVSLATGPLQQSTSLRLRAGGVTSPAWRLIVQPSLTATVQTRGAVTTLDASATGARAGDPVVLLVRRDGALVTQAHGVLDATGSARFDVATPARPTRYVVRLPATPAHAYAQVHVTVSPPATAPSMSPSASPSASAGP